MRRDEYLLAPDVAAFRSWLVARLDQPGAFQHGYKMRKTKASWNCDCLYSAFEKYRWPFTCKLLGKKGQTFEDSRQVLNQLQSKVRSAVRAHDDAAAAAACLAILEWGGVQAWNGKWIEENYRRLIWILEHDGSLLRQPAPTADSLRDLHRFNAGIVKIYSLLLDDFIIYDGRVGAALGLLVREWCQSTGHSAVPGVLRFPWGAPKEAQDLGKPKTRNPSRKGFHFPALGQQKERHALWTIRASWLLQSALMVLDNRFRNEPCPLRALEAALFMIGYDLGPPA